jgi:transcriptional regulator with XRE-family HTH domain
MQTGEDDKTPLERYLGINIRELRQRHDLTIAQVGAQVGVSRDMRSKIENAQTSAGLELLDRVAQTLRSPHCSAISTCRKAVHSSSKRAPAWGWSAKAPTAVTPITCFPAARFRTSSSNPS